MPSNKTRFDAISLLLEGREHQFQLSCDFGISRMPIIDIPADMESFPTSFHQRRNKYQTQSGRTVAIPCGIAQEHEEPHHD